MRLKILIASALSLILQAATTLASAQDVKPSFAQALLLYENGMYERARAIFETCKEEPTANAYAVLCAIKLRSNDADKLFDRYQASATEDFYKAQMHYERAISFFDQCQYSSAAAEFNAVDTAHVSAMRSAEIVFKRGLCAYEMQDYALAQQYFTKVDAMPVGDYTSTARYLLAYMDYTAGAFPSAERWFALAGQDPQYKEVADFFIVDCEFNLKNYDYVIEQGLPIFELSSAERRMRLARMLSESYLIKGDKENAYKFYDLSSHQNMTRADYFFAGSVLYAVKNYAEAIDNFTKMTDRTDALGQVAEYQLANCYLETRNNVAAMYAFEAASKLSHDPRIQEDAMFNYAKLTFDLNKDPGGFNRYIQSYSTTTKGDMIYGYMALAALYSRDYAAAVEAYNHIDDLDRDMQSNYIKANFLRASQLMSSGAWKDAIPCLKSTAYYLSKTDPLNQYSRYCLAEAYFRSENPSMARGQYMDLYNESALYDSSEGALLSYNIAYCYLSEADWSNASKWFDRYVAEGALLFREDALTRRADCDFARKDYKAAINSYQSVLSEFFTPGNIYPYYRQALSYGLSGNLSRKAQVLSNVEKASTQSALYPEAMYELGATYLELKDYSAAARVFTKLRSTSQDSSYVAKSLIGLGMVSRNSGNYEKALEHYKSVVALLPGSEYSEDALLAIESIYQHLKQPEKYLEYMEENALKNKLTEADRELMYFNTAEQVYLSGNPQQAVLSLQKYIETYPNGAKLAQAYFYLADTYKTLDNKEKAVETFAKAIERGADDSFTESSRLGYASLSYSLERYQDAYNGYYDLLRSARLDANRSVAKIGMMRAAYRAKMYDNAIEACAAVLLMQDLSSELKREAEYIQAKSYLSTSRRDDALKLFKSLSAQSTTDEGAEASYILIQDIYDNGRFEAVESEVYTFAQNCGSQSYWLAKAFVVLGDSFLARGLSEQAKATYESIIDGYEPRDDKDEVLDSVKIRLERMAKQ